MYCDYILPHEMYFFKGTRVHEQCVQSSPCNNDRVEFWPARSKVMFSLLLISARRCWCSSGSHEAVGYLDTDVGQPEFTVPGCLSLHIVREPIFGKMRGPCSSFVPVAIHLSRGRIDNYFMSWIGSFDTMMLLQRVHFVLLKWTVKLRALVALIALSFE